MVKGEWRERRHQQQHQQFGSDDRIGLRACVRVWRMTHPPLDAGEGHRVIRSPDSGSAAKSAGWPAQRKDWVRRVRHSETMTRSRIWAGFETRVAAAAATLSIEACGDGDGTVTVAVSVDGDGADALLQDWSDWPVAAVPLSAVCPEWSVSIWRSGPTGKSAHPRPPSFRLWCASTRRPNHRTHDMSIWTVSQWPLCSECPGSYVPTCPVFR